VVDLRSGVVHGNTTLSLGAGKGAVLLASFGAQTTVINGNLTVTASNGDVDVGSNGTFDPSANTALIGGNATFNLGNGKNSVSFDSGGTIGGTISFRGGNGGNHLLLTGSQAYRVKAQFGSGNDGITLNNPSAVLTGSLNGGGGSNQLTVTSGTLGLPLTRVHI
jgi:hypothetical protein